MVEKKKNTQFSVILVEPKYGGNIGSVARVMMNFDFEHLVLVNSHPFDDECYSRAMHAQKILYCAKKYSSFDEAVKGFDFLVATSSVENVNEKRHLREAMLVEDFTQKISEVKGNIGLVFGREDFGLFNEEIARCDIMVKIPTSDGYPSMNLSHSVAVFLYSLYCSTTVKKRVKKQIDPVEKEKMFEFFSRILDEVSYPTHKKKNTKIMFIRLIGRSMPSYWEYHTLMGVLSDTLKKLEKKKP